MPSLSPKKAKLVYKVLCQKEQFTDETGTTKRFKTKKYTLQKHIFLKDILV